MNTIVFDCNADDMIPMTGQILVTAFDSGLVQLAWRASQWHSWSPPLMPEQVQTYDPQATRNP